MACWVFDKKGLIFKKDYKTIIEDHLITNRKKIYQKLEIKIDTKN